MNTRHPTFFSGCHCTLHSRRQFTQLLAGSATLLVTGTGLGLGLGTGNAWAQDGSDLGVSKDVGRTSRMAKLVPASQVEGAASQQYLQMMQGAQQQRALAPADHPQVVRLRAIAQRIIPFATAWNDRAAQWKWEVNVIGSSQLNAFCMPGGKIAFYYGILQKLQLSDDEVATIMGHEVAHALREHARERMGKSMATRGAIEIGSAILGLGGVGHMAAGMGGQLLSLKFGRDDETEADIVGMDLAARAGYDPAAGVTLWQKMMAANKGAPPQWMSTHPASDTRIKDIQSKLPKVTPLYAKAAKPTQVYGPPPLNTAPAVSLPAQR
jgi:predicted Zn-dependent protease